MHFSKIFALIFIIYGFLLASTYIDDVIEFDEEWACGSYNFLGECTLLQSIVLDLFIVGLMSLSYYFDGEFITRKRNIASLLLIIYFTIGIGTEISAAIFFAIFGFMAAFDGGKNAGMMLNETYKLDLIKKTSEALGNSKQTSIKENKKHYTLDGIIGIGILTTTGLAISVSINLFSLEILNIIFPTIIIDGITYDVHNVSVIISLFLVFYRSSLVCIDIIFANRYISKIPKYENILPKISRILRVIAFILFIVSFSIFFDRFVVFISLPEIQPFVQAIMLLLWGFGYIINR